VFRTRVPAAQKSFFLFGALDFEGNGGPTGSTQATNSHLTPGRDELIDYFFAHALNLQPHRLYSCGTTKSLGSWELSLLLP